MKNKSNSLIGRVWHDPVGSLVIATILISLISYICSKTILPFLSYYICIKRWILLCFVVLSVLFFVILIIKFINSQNKKINITPENRRLDIKLIKNILDDLPNVSVSLRRLDFQDRLFTLDCIHLFGSLSEKMDSDPAFEFIDPELEKLRCDLNIAIKNLLMNTAVNTFPDRTNPNYQTAYPDNWEDLEDGKKREYIKRVFDELNRLKDSLYDQYSNLIKTSQKKLGISLVKE